MFDPGLATNVHVAQLLRVDDNALYNEYCKHSYDDSACFHRVTFWRHSLDNMLYNMFML